MVIGLGVLALLAAAALVVRTGRGIGQAKLSTRVQGLLGGRSLWVSGLAGMGKTAMLRAVARECLWPSLKTFEVSSATA